jgi:hypothetical protein
MSAVIDNKRIDWKGFSYEAKPFTYRGFLLLQEAASRAVLSQGGISFEEHFANKCNVLLRGLSPQAQQRLDNGQFASSVMDEPEDGDQEGAFEIPGFIDFLSESWSLKGMRLALSAPDLAPAIVQATEKATEALSSIQKSQSTLETEPVPSS